MHGSFSGVLEMPTKDAVSAGAGGQLAVIGDDASCDDGGLPIALDQALGEMSAQDVLDLVAAVQGVTRPTRGGSRIFNLGRTLHWQVACGGYVRRRRTTP